MENNPTKSPVSNGNPALFKLIYTIAILMFFLPFIEIRCNGLPLAKATGIELVLGTEIKPINKIDRPTNTFDWIEHGKKRGPNIFALMAIGMALVGLGFSFSKLKQKLLLNFAIGALGVITMTGLAIQLKTSLNDELKVQMEEGNANISLSFTAWFIFVFICFIIITLVGWKHMKNNNANAT
ncbi:MAG: hypothetical protein EPN92_00680 [Chitinophagaceae bacterium]|nr:MAG: hypothetical protein EPN92_00680 [Chitinophagaceae bacterium]